MTTPQPNKPPQPDLKYSYTKCLTIILTAYATAIAVACLSYPYIKTFHTDPLIQSLLLDLVATTVVFIFSLSVQNSSIYDPYWGFAPLPLIIFWMIVSPQAMSLKDILTLFAVGIYVVRHMFLFFRFWPGFKYEDFRYLNFKRALERFPVIYWIFSYLGLHVFPTLMVFMGMLPVYFTLQATKIESPVFYIGVAVTIIGVIIEHIADEQLYPWRTKNTNQIIDEGLWRYSRHPNYFGEIVAWYGLYIIYIGTSGDQKYTWIGAFAMYLMFDIATIPMMEKHLLKKRPIYAVQQKRVSKIFFWLRNEKAAKEYKAKMEKIQQ